LLKSKKRATKFSHLDSKKVKNSATLPENDPGYRERYLVMLKRKGEEPFGMLARYIDYFDRWSRVVSSKKRSSSAAAQDLAKRQRYNTRSAAPVSSENVSEVFPFGQYSGETFQQVTLSDPSYHLRFKDMNNRPNAVLDRYIAWFDRSGPGPIVAHRAHRDDLACSLGLDFTCCYNGYDEQVDQYPW
jgi:hypothetical protein